MLQKWRNFFYVHRVMLQCDVAFWKMLHTYKKKLRSGYSCNSEFFFCTNDRGTTHA
jgi:hypothetical protein